MKTLCLVPYCPWPATTGTKVEMMKHLQVLRDLGQCTIVSARSKPVGFGWTDRTMADLQNMGFKLVFREDTCSKTTWNFFGIAYAAIAKLMRFDKAFGHSNPYHRWAFSKPWLKELSRSYDLCVMQYSFWADFDLQCRKAIVVHELLSNYHWWGDGKELRDLSKADLVLVVGKDEETKLKRNGLNNVHWSPPAVRQGNSFITKEVGLIGTKAPQNLEGLRWLESAGIKTQVKVQVFGNLAEEVRADFLVSVGRYGAHDEPYKACGILLLTRPDRPGLQIKAVEALAHGRAIVARRGSMRGLPEVDKTGDKAWITVDSPQEMLEVAARLQADQKERESLAIQARSYYKRYLDFDSVTEALRVQYRSLIN